MKENIRVTTKLTAPLWPLTFTHWSGLTSFKTKVSSGLSISTCILALVGSSLVQILMGTIHIGKSSPKRGNQKKKEGLRKKAVHTEKPRMRLKFWQQLMSVCLNLNWQKSEGKGQFWSPAPRVSAAPSSAAVWSPNIAVIAQKGMNTLPLLPALILPAYGPLAQNFFWTNFNTLSSSC